jgi:hypothetical protein
MVKSLSLSLSIEGHAWVLQRGMAPGARERESERERERARESERQRETARESERERERERERWLQDRDDEPDGWSFRFRSFMLCGAARAQSVA